METLLVTLVLLAAVAASGVLRAPWRAPSGLAAEAPGARTRPERPVRQRPPAASTTALRAEPDRGQLRQLALRLSRIESALDSGEAVVSGGASPAATVDLRRRVAALARVGMEPAKMARELGVSLGEVELALRMATTPVPARTSAPTGPTTRRP